MAVLIVLGVSAAASPAPDPPLLVVLSDSGATRGELPMVTAHPEARRYLDVLERGYSGKLLRLYRALQTLRSRRDGIAIEPAYLVLTDHQGGFPRQGLVLDGREMPGAAYVDLHRGSPLSGRFGAIDQIFPHELLHHMLAQLVGEPPEGGANQVHAIGVRTDPRVAFNEGFAEHAQVAAVDDPDAVPETAALAGDLDLFGRTERDLAAYRLALAARWAPAARARLAFLLWFSQDERVLRYHAVKANRFAYEVDVPPGLLTPRRLYHAYLLQNVLPGDPPRAPKSQGRLRSTEGAVSTLFARLMSDARLQQSVDATVAEAFDVDPAAPLPMERAYLKLFHAFDRHKPHDASAALSAYVATFPGEAAVVREVAAGVGFDIDAARVPEIWLANDGFTTGTTLFDQFRTLPRSHTFDLNAASLVDLLGVEGMTREAADAVLRGGPYASIEELSRVAALPPAMRERFLALASRMTRLRAETIEEAATLSIQSIVLPYVYRAIVWLVLTGVVAALAYRQVRQQRIGRLALAGAGVALLGLGAAWLTDRWGGALAWTLPTAAFGLPGALWQAARHRSASRAVRVLAAWAAASLAPFAVTRAWW